MRSRKSMESFAAVDSATAAGLTPLMATTWADVTSWDSEKLMTAIRALSRRCQSVRDLEDYVERASALTGWTGATKDAAQQSLVKSKNERKRAKVVGN